MLKDKQTQDRLEMVTLNQLVPEDHLLRLIDRHIDFSFIRERTEHLYCLDNGRPGIPPEQLFKMLFVGYLYGIRSERQLVREIEVNVAYRWFVGLGLTDKVCNASTFSQNRGRRFSGSEIEQQIFDALVEQALDHGLIEGKVLYTDSTHLKASANKHKHRAHEVEVSPPDYLDELERAVTLDRKAHGKAALKPRGSSAPDKRRIKQSTTDPDSGFLTREGKPKGFYYLDHRTVDGKHNLITDSHVTAGNVHDTRPYLGRLDHQIKHFGFSPAAVGLDAGYHSAALLKGLDDRGIFAAVGYRRPNKPKHLMAKRHYHYDKVDDCYMCPAGQRLEYSTTNRLGYREYRSNAQICKGCASRDRCTRSQNMTKVITRHVWADHVDQARENRLSPRGKLIYARRKETVERSFADAKQLHGHRYARFRGIDRVQAQCLLAAACQNMKKIAMLLARNAKKDSPFWWLMVTAIIKNDGLSQDHHEYSMVFEA